MRVQDAQLNGWYRTLDALAAHKATIEKQLFLRLRDLFSLRAEMVFYDSRSAPRLRNFALPETIDSS